MNALTFDGLGAELAARGLRPKRAGRNWQCSCPVHDDRTPSLSVGIGTSGRMIVHCHAGCDGRAVIASLAIDAPLSRTESVEFRNGPAPWVAANWREVVRASVCANGPTIVQEREATLGVPRGGLALIGCVWVARLAAIAAPMWGSQLTPDPIGVRIRSDSGSKYCMRGSINGLFRPAVRPLNGTLYLPEGMTDTAAMCGLGLDAIGRPSCTGGRDLVRAVVRAEPPDRRIVIVADDDDPGRLGARILRDELASDGRAASVMTPPNGIKDVRAWCAKGGTAASVEWFSRQKR